MQRRVEALEFFGKFSIGVDPGVKNIPRGILFFVTYCIFY